MEDLDSRRDACVLQLTKAVLAAASERKDGGPRFLVALDGRCAAGKTTLGTALGKRLDCPVLHMDDFFLTPEQRTKERLACPGGNVDYERFLLEALLPFRSGEAFCYRPYACHSGSFAQAVEVLPGSMGIVEGSYACHPRLRTQYDLRVFLQISPEEQRQRIVKRNGAAGARRFIAEWIPLEELYFSGCQVMESCELVLETGTV